jgi:hypothetical protein
MASRNETTPQQNRERCLLGSLVFTLKPPIGCPPSEP